MCRINLGCHLRVLGRFSRTMRGPPGAQLVCDYVGARGHAGRCPGPRYWMVRKERIPTPAQDHDRRFAGDDVASDYRQSLCATVALPLRST